MAIRRTPAKKRVKTTRRISRRVARPWSKEEMTFMRKYYRRFETAWIARQLGRTVYSVRYKAVDLSLKKASPSVWRGKHGPNNAFKPPVGWRASKPARKTTTPNRKTTSRSYKASSLRQTNRPTARKITRRAPRRR